MREYAIQSAIVPHVACAHALQGVNGVQAINDVCGDAIDFYNVQFYNQMGTTYMTCWSLVPRWVGFTPDCLRAHTVP